MAQAFFPTKDGHIGDIKKLTNIELYDIIRRQEQLIKKQSFLSHLQDKGAKVKEHLVVLKQEQERRNKLQQSLKEKKDNVNNALDGRELTGALESLCIQDSGGTTTNTPKHQYDIAIEKAKASTSQRRPFRLNRDLKIDKLADLPKEIKKTKEYLHTKKAPAAFTDKPRQKVASKEESAVVPPTYKFGSTRQIDLVESLELQRKHNQQYEIIQVQMAAERLTSSLAIKMDTYNPEGVDMSYRSRDAIDSDDEGTSIVGGPHEEKSDSDSDLEPT